MGYHACLWVHVLDALVRVCVHVRISGFLFLCVCPKLSVNAYPSVLMEDGRVYKYYWHESWTRMEGGGM